MKKTMITVAVCIYIAVSLNAVNAYETFHGKNEMIYWDKAKSYNGYTLFSPAAFPYHFLIDMEGSVVNIWPVSDKSWDPNPQMMENGNIIYRIGSREQSGGWHEVDWDGKVVWKWENPRSDLITHHDQIRIFNKKINAYTTLGIVQRFLSHEDALAAGADPEKCTSDSAPDGIIEVDMNGNIIWEWWTWDHAIQFFDAKKAKYVGEGKTIADHPGKIDMNWGMGVTRDLVHFNSLDYNPALDQIVVNNSRGSEFWILDHGGTFVPGDYERSRALAAGPKGDFLYRWGNPSLYGAGAEPSWKYGVSSLGHQQLFFTHDIQWIKPGHPGAGNFLIFDNNSLRPGPTFSRLIEINPYDGPMEKGVYVPEMKAGHDENGISKQIVWEFHSNEPNSFYSYNISGTQRLPNGNTLACSGRHGHFFEVTKEGEVVWEYVNPVTQSPGKEAVIYTSGQEGPSFHTFRCYRYGPDHPALKGKDLKPKGKITEIFAPFTKSSVVDLEESLKKGVIK